MVGYDRITKREFYQLGGLSNPRLCTYQSGRGSYLTYWCRRD
jgi:hypothetical protein